MGLLFSYMPRASRDAIIHDLSSFFSIRSDVAFAFLFGSFSRETSSSSSDIDVAVYFYPKSGELEIEDEVYYDGEDEIWAYIDHATGRETDLLVMNRAPARVAHTAMSEGVVLRINDGALFLRVLCAAGRLFEEYGEFTDSFAEIKARSTSLSPVDRDRLLRVLDFLEAEIGDAHVFSGLSYEEYMGDSGKRRNVERWIENCVNASVDTAKILVASQKRHIPQTYRETISQLKLIEAFSPPLIDRLARNTRMRNILAHEYLDIRFTHIKSFIESAEENYRGFIEEARKYISA
jgi:uncharacterized protein YutE (UPF0331/DUF86 family)/predicted nucleotidyltransferase